MSGVIRLLAQVSGRAGRRGKQGKVVVQTYDPYHRVIKQVIDNNYADLYHTEMAERKSFMYPPFYRIINLDIKHKNPDDAYIVRRSTLAQRIPQALWRTCDRAGAAAHQQDP
jgi:primosomal protein N'